MLVGARTCAHVCVRTFLDVFAQKFVKTSLCMCYMMLFTCALACAHYARTMHVRALQARARSHSIGWICYKIDGDIPWVTKTCMPYLIFTNAGACARYACVCTHMRACVRSHNFGGIRSTFCENITLHVLHAFYVHTCVCTLCPHYARACTARMCALTHYWTDSLQN
jgi:hypothetical protein